MKIVFIGENPTVRRLVELSAAKAGMMVEMSTWSDCDLTNANFVIAEYEALGEDGISVLSFAPANVKKIAVMPRDQEVPDVFDASIRKPFLPTELVDLFLSHAPIESPEETLHNDDVSPMALMDDDLDINLDELDDMVHGLHDEMKENSEHDIDLSDVMNDSLGEDEGSVADDEVVIDDYFKLDVETQEDESLEMSFDEPSTNEENIALGDEYGSEEKIDYDDMNDEPMTSEQTDFAEIEEEKQSDDSLFDEALVTEIDELLDNSEVINHEEEHLVDTEDFDSYLDDAVDEKIEEKKNDDSILDMNDIAQLKDLLEDDDFDSLNEKEMRAALGEDSDEYDFVSESDKPALETSDNQETHEELSVVGANPVDVISLLSTLSSQKLREVLDGATVTISISYPKNGEKE
jgi:uncharacterized membrane protein